MHTIWAAGPQFFVPEKHKHWFDILCVNETHVPEGPRQQDLISLFEKKSYHIKGSINPAKPTGSGGTHGGELIAVKTSLDSSPVDSFVLDSIVEHTCEQLSFASIIIRFKKISVL